MKNLRLFEDFGVNSEYWRELVGMDWNTVPSELVGLKNVFGDARRLAIEQNRVKEFDDIAALYEPEEWYSIQNFTTGSGWQMIANIRNGVPSNDDKMAIDAIGRLPKEPGIHYRGLGFDYRRSYDSMLDDYRVGNDVTVETIWSASMSKDIGSFYRDTVPNGRGEFRGRKTKYGILLEIDGTSGRRIDMFARKRSTWSLREVVYLPGTVFEVTDAEIGRHKSTIRLKEA